MIRKIITLIFFVIMPFTSYSDVKVLQTMGFVHSTEVLKKYITQKVPKKQKVCEIKRVPINENTQGFGADNLIGALIGGAIGNQLGKGGGKQGSTAIGAIIGSEIVRNDKQAHAQNNSFTEREICRIERIISTETIEQITGYKIIIEVDGELITVNSNKSYNPGDEILVNKKIKYTIN